MTLVRPLRSPVRVGVLGAAKVAAYAMVDPARRSDRVSVVAIAARDPERAERFAREHGIARVEVDYDALVRAGDVDAVYVALPAALHAAWTLRAIDAGKHVLCEKPLASNAGEAERMVDAARARGVVLMEALHWRFHPLAARLREIVTSTDVGRIREVAAEFSVGVPDLADFRYDVALGGGAMMDLGCYPIHWMRFVTGAEPVVRRAEAEQAPRGVDVTMSADLVFPGDSCEVEGHAHCSMAGDAPMRAWLRVRGDRGEVFVDNPLAPHLGHRIDVLGVDTSGDGAHGTWTERVDGRSTYDHQLEAFAAAVLDGAPVATGGADAVASMRVIDAIYRAAGLSPRGETGPGLSGTC